MKAISSAHNQDNSSGSSISKGMTKILLSLKNIGPSDPYDFKEQLQLSYTVTMLTWRCLVTFELVASSKNFWRKTCKCYNLKWCFKWANERIIPGNWKICVHPKFLSFEKSKCRALERIQSNTSSFKFWRRCCISLNYKNHKKEL